MKRRDFLKSSGTAVAAASALGALVTSEAPAEAVEIGPQRPRFRRAAALDLRVGAAHAAAYQPLPSHATNGDEEACRNHIASYSKALPHDDRGEVSPAAYQALLVALATGDPDRFEQIPLGGTLRLTSPQSAYAFDLIGPDSHSLFVRPAPRFNSPEAAAEMAEDYWMALCRDVPFSRFDSDPTVAAAGRDLSRFTDFRGPKQEGQVRP